MPLTFEDAVNDNPQMKANEQYFPVVMFVSRRTLLIFFLFDNAFSPLVTEKAWKLYMRKHAL